MREDIEDWRIENGNVIVLMKCEGNIVIEIEREELRLGILRGNLRNECKIESINRRKIGIEVFKLDDFKVEKGNLRKLEIVEILVEIILDGKGKKFEVGRGGERIGMEEKVEDMIKIKGRNIN